MHNYLSAVELGYRLPDGRFLFNNLTFSFSAVRAGLVGANGIGKTQYRASGCAAVSSVSRLLTRAVLL